MGDSANVSEIMSDNDVEPSEANDHRDERPKKRIRGSAKIYCKEREFQLRMKRKISSKTR